MDHTYTSTFIAYNVELPTVPATVSMIAMVLPMVSTPTVPAEQS